MKKIILILLVIVSLFIFTVPAYAETCNDCDGKTFCETCKNEMQDDGSTKPNGLTIEYIKKEINFSDGVFTYLELVFIWLCSMIIMLTIKFFYDIKDSI